MVGRGRLSLFSLVVGVALLPVFLAIPGGPAAAQSTGDVTGHVRNGEGKALPGVAVKLLRAGSQDTLEQTSNAEGKFHFDDLKEGVYVVTAAPEGYAAVTCPGTRIVRGMTKRFEVKLMPDGGEPSACAAAAP